MTFPHSATVTRNTQNGMKTSYVPVGTVQCFLQPLDSEESTLYGITMSKGSTLYIPFDADIEQSDRLTIDGNNYSIKGLRTHSYGNLKHKRAILEQLA